MLTESEKSSLINYLAAHPSAGDLIKGSGGIRKFRWSAQEKGKSGGVRVIYYYHNLKIPLFLLTLFTKGEKANLSQAECNDLKKLSSIILQNYGGRHG